MIFLENAKIHGLLPHWASFPGVTVLFNNPGDSLERTSHGIQRIRCNPRGRPALALYSAMAGAFKSVVGGERALFDHHLLGLSEGSFHVTYADLVNVGNVHHLDPLARYEAEAFFKRLPEAILQGLPPLLDAPAIQRLLKSDWSVRLRFRDLAIWGDQVLVARLQPADNATADVLHRMVTLRSAIDDELAGIGKPRNPTYSPHVSLGYFLDGQAGVRAKSMELSRWNAEFVQLVGETEIKFSGVSLYGFTNMVEFWKADVEDPPALRVSIAAIDRDQRLREKGYRKVSVTEIYKSEEPATAVLWDPTSPSGRCPVWATGNMEIAYFNETAAQDRHFHMSATEIYTVLRGSMVIEVQGESHHLQQGETIIVAPGAVHQVGRSARPFLTMVVAVNSLGNSDKFTVGARIPVPNVTLVAFYGRPKPPALASLIDWLNLQIDEILVGSGGIYNRYGAMQGHLTALGIEGVPAGTDLFNGNYRSNDGSLTVMDAPGLVALLSALAQKRSPLFTIRFGGFAPCTCECKGAELFSWNCASGGEFHSFNRSAFQGSFYIPVRKGPVVLTGWPVDEEHRGFPRALYGLRYAAGGRGFLDKYHKREKPYWRDDDCWITLGKIDVEDDTRTRIETKVREALGRMDPVFIDITPDDLSVVVYEDTELKEARAFSLIEILKNPEILQSIYSDLSARLAGSGA